MDLRQLQLFVAVAEELHFGRAAARLGMAQPPLSQRIRQLETELGARLLDRTSRSVSLTPAGARLLEEGRQLIRQADAAVAAVRATAAGTSGNLRIGFAANSALGLLPGLIARYREACPTVCIALDEFDVADAVDALKERRIDLALVRDPCSHADLNAECIAREPLMAFLPHGHALSGPPSMALSSLADESFALFPREAAPGLHDTIVAGCHAAGFSPRIEYSAPSWPTVVSLVGAGLAVTIAPASASALLPASVTPVALPATTQKAELWLVLPVSRPSPAARSFLKSARLAFPSASAN